jgi:outer membrane biosynthesis protein TonB
MYPFLDQENNLFFSSDGIKGFGGYDIYLCRYNGRGWDKPVNLTQRINTPGDDVAFTLSRLDGRSAFYSTRTKTGNGAPELFRVTFRDQYAINKLTNLSNAFKYLAQAGFTPEETTVQEEVKKVEPVKQKKEPAAEPVQPQKQPEIKKEPVKPPVEEAPIASNAIIYRVQFASNAKPKGSYEITSDGKKYKTFEYLFNGAYRSCAGDFTVPGFATNLQNQMKREGYTDAFVVAFRNNERLTGSIQSIAKSQEQAGQKTSSETAQAQKPAEIKQEPVKPPVEEAAPTGDAVIYRVQFTGNAKPKGSYEITAGGKTYKTFEYLYNGAYRSCAGAFTNRASAIVLQNSLKREGFPDAFVVAFKNNIRLNDPALFK